MMKLSRLTVTGVMATVVLVSSCTTAPTGEATTTFDGGACIYDGPAEFELGTEVTYTFVNTSNGVSAGYGVWVLPDGTTLDDLENNGIHGVGTNPRTDLRGLLGASSPGIDKELTVTLDTPGTWVVNCFHPVPGGADDFPAATFVVVSD
jgi:hypothetical protein